MQRVKNKTEGADARHNKLASSCATLKGQLKIYIACILAAPTLVQADVFNIPAGDSAALIKAITDANNNGEDDDIVLEAGTYTLDSVDNDTDGPNGLPSIISPITISVSAADAGPAVIKRADSSPEVDIPRFRILHVDSTGILTLDRLVLTGGSGNRGGGIFNHGMLKISNSTISSNFSGTGGGGIINTDGGTLSITTSTIRMNTNDVSGGGGILNFGTATLDKSTVSDNTSGAGFGGTGGAGIFNRSAGTLNITNSTISGNKMRTGGNGRAGGIDNRGGTLNLNNVTITNNTGDIQGGGIFNSGTVNLKNTIIARNVTMRTGSPDCHGTLTSQGYNLIGDTGFLPSTTSRPPACVITDAAGNKAPGDQVGTTGGGVVNPGLKPLADNGGPTQTHALEVYDLRPDLTSPALDAGNPAEPSPGGDACERTDQRGSGRPADGNEDGVPVCDIGAFEFTVADLFVSKTDSPDPVTVGDNLTYTLIVTNIGPDTATGVSLTDTLPAGVTLVSATPSQGNCHGTAQLTCELGNIPIGTARVEIIVTPPVQGPLTNIASVRGTEFDPDQSDNETMEGTTVNPVVNPVSCGRLPATIVGTPSDDTLIGTNGRDVIHGLGGNDTIRGLGGNDIICGGRGNDTLRGGRGNDILRGGRGNDRLFGEDGNDALNGGRGRDFCGGGSGRNTVVNCENR